MGSKYGRRRIIRKDKVDRISNLPDDIIFLILSQLPAKWAVSTSSLSKRWKKLWTSITCLDFKNHTSSLGNYNDVEKFTTFIGHVFRSCDPKKIQKLVLHFPWFRADKSSVLTWIDEWVKHEISELDLYVYNFPLRVFSCTNLRVLTIGDCYDYDPEVVSFNLPSLKFLCINGRFSRFMESLISNCLVLEDLTLDGSNVWYTANTFKVSAHTLKTLRLQLAETHIPKLSHVIIVETPKLEFLHLNESFFDYNTNGSFSSLVKAYMNIRIISMGQRFMEFHHFTMPNFSSLTCFEVIACDNRFWTMLPKIIRSTPSLKVLSLEQEDMHDNATYDEYDWAEPKYVATCVGHHLRVIKFRGFKGRKHELQIVKYFLGSAEVLQILTVNCGRLGREEEIKFCWEVLRFQRVSKYCQVLFNGNII